MIAMGRQNLDAIERTVTSTASTATSSFRVVRRGHAEHQVSPLREEYDETRAHGMATSWLTASSCASRVDSPTFLAGMHDPDAAILEPARLAWGLRDACLRSGVRIAEHTPVTSLAKAGSGVAVHTGEGGSTPSASYSPPTRTRRCSAACA